MKPFLRKAPRRNERGFADQLEAAPEIGVATVSSSRDSHQQFVKGEVEQYKLKKPPTNSPRGSCFFGRFSFSFSQPLMLRRGGEMRTAGGDRRGRRSRRRVRRRQRGLLPDERLAAEGRHGTRGGSNLLGRSISGRINVVVVIVVVPGNIPRLLGSILLGAKLSDDAAETSGKPRRAHPGKRRH